MVRAVVCLAFVVGCVESAAVECADGIVCPQGNSCDDVHAGCASPEQLSACSAKTDGTECTAAPVGAGFCDASVCMASRCGDGYRATEEICDGDKFATISRCDQVGYYSTTSLACSETCELDETPCVSAGTCGDDKINGPEICDGAMGPVETCLDFGFGAGQIGCALTCGPELSECIPFGWQSIPMPERATSIHGTSESNIWVVGQNKMVRRFDGTVWIDVASCMLGDASLVYVLSTTDAFVIDNDPTTGTVGLVRITGAGCDRYEAAGQPAIDVLWASSIDDAYLGNGDGIYHFAASSVTPTTLTGMAVTSIWGTGPSDVYAVELTTPGLRHYNGSTWSSGIVVPGMTNPNAMWGTGPGDYYVAGRDTQTPARPLVKHYTTAGGWTDILARLPVLGTTGPGSSAVLGQTVGARTFVLANGGSSEPHYLAGDGTGWADLAAPITTYGVVPYVAPNGFIYMAVHQPRVFVFAGSTRLDLDELYSPYKVVAGGANIAAALTNFNEVWTWNGAALTRDLNNISDILATPTGDVFAVSSSGVVKRQSDGSYAPVTGTPGAKIAGTSQTDLWIGTDSTTTITHYTGTTTPYTLPALGPSTLFALSPTLAFAGFYSPGIARWDGNNWTMMTSPLRVTRGFYGASSTEVFAWGDSLSSDHDAVVRYDGNSWTSVTNLPPALHVYAVLGTSNAMFVGADNGAWYFDGQSWTPVAGGDATEVRSIAGRGDSIYLATAVGVHQLLRTRSW